MGGSHRNVSFAVAAVVLLATALLLAFRTPSRTPLSGAQPPVATTAIRTGQPPSRSDALVSFLQPATALLVLDNCEHLVIACASLANTLLRACPRLRILATSRQPLGLIGEISRSVPPLPVPPDDAGRRPNPKEALGYAAVRLFTERGYEGTSIRDLADALGMTKSALYYHFTSKEAIVMAVVDDGQRRYRVPLGLCRIHGGWVVTAVGG